MNDCVPADGMTSNRFTSSSEDGSWSAGVRPRRACVLVFAGVDPSGGAGIYADVQAIAAVGAHALAVVTVITAQDNNHVHALYPVPAAQIRAQTEVLIASMPIAAVKIGIVGSLANAQCIADLLRTLRMKQPNLPIVLDPVLASGQGDALTQEDALAVIAPLLSLATLVTPNLPEAAMLFAALGDSQKTVIEKQTDWNLDRNIATTLFALGAQHVLIKGGHSVAELGREGLNTEVKNTEGLSEEANNKVNLSEPSEASEPICRLKTNVVNRLFSASGETHRWSWPRLAGKFHGSGCTLASAIAGLLADGATMARACEDGQRYCQATLGAAFAIAAGQVIPDRRIDTRKTS